MHFLAWSQWGFFSRPSNQSKSATSRLTKSRVRDKHGDKKLAVLDVLEIRTLIGSFLADIAVTAQGVVAAERARDPFGEPSWLDLSVSGGSSSGTSPTIIDRGASQGSRGKWEWLPVHVQAAAKLVRVMVFLTNLLRRPRNRHRPQTTSGTSRCRR